MQFPGADTEPAWDCGSEIRFRDIEGLRRWADWYRGPEAQVLRDGEERFMLTSERVVAATEPADTPLHR
ncbi:MAG TPA: hypothetical protein VGF93_07605 [Solirubrobacteraceae bacterium]